MPLSLAIPFKTPRSDPGHGDGDGDGDGKEGAIDSGVAAGDSAACCISGAHLMCITMYCIYRNICTSYMYIYII